MKKFIFLAAVLFASFAYAQQDATLTQREVRDPRKLEAILEANAANAQSRLAVLESTIQRDTNATTTVTAYNAPSVNALLLGADGGTNTIWVSTATGTNAWVKWLD